MAVQETVANAVGNLLHNATGMLAAFAAVAALWLGSDFLSNLLDVNLPLRQLMFGRNLQGLALSCRLLFAIAASYCAAKLLPAPAPRLRGSIVRLACHGSMNRAAHCRSCGGTGATANAA